MANYSIKAFTLVELLVTIAIISILASIAITGITNASRDSNIRLAEQQQAVLQTALTAWIVNSSNTNGIEATRTNYLTLLQGGHAQVFQAIQIYLDPKIRNIFNATSSGITSTALASAGRILTFTTWNGTDPPFVQQQNVP
ncbi:MAG: prepilin-type N-terminal cleavage/methylation domain-containing protein [Chthoniobacterales bacterium]|nr:prepilin-type N-terminal cleavage/methylation domain-containing protein [Chthoniobacterales bacterium]MCX7713532.1 prepilin-type N-terminal cleavage/methylation domain-containing protein [Chthoniobacterales bacterium]